jgi:hypothetical protein
MGIDIGGNVFEATDFNPSGEAASPTVVTRGLVLWLDGGNNSSYINSSNYYDCGYGCQYYSSNPGCTNCNSQWKDMSGNGNDGSLTNGAAINYTTGGGSILFDGANDFVIIPTFTNGPTSQITTEAWIRPNKSSVGTGTQRGGAVSSSSSMYLGIIDSTDGGSTFSLHWANQTSNSRLYNWNGSIPNNAWTHIVGTYDGGTSRAYVNGVQVDAWAQTGTVTAGTYYVGTYGGATADGVHNFKGDISIARIYNVALTVTEIVQNYNNGRSRFGV